MNPGSVAHGAFSGDELPCRPGKHICEHSARRASLMDAAIKGNQPGVPGPPLPISRAGIIVMQV